MRGSPTIPVTGTVFTAKDETKLEVISSNNEVGSAGQQHFLKDAPGHISYAKRHVLHGDAMSVFTLFIVDTIVECTQVEARSKTGNEDWSTYTVEIYGLLGVMYTRGLLAKG